MKIHKSILIYIRIERAREMKGKIVPSPEAQERSLRHKVKLKERNKKRKRIKKWQKKG